MKNCPNCNCDLGSYEEDEMEGKTDDAGMVIQEIAVPGDKQAVIKNKLREIGKLLASVVDEE
jgi:hypothetical protein